MECYGVVVYVFVFSVDGCLCFVVVIWYFVVVIGNINMVKLMLVSEYFLIVVRICIIVYFIWYFSLVSILVGWMVEVIIVIIGFNGGINYIWVYGWYSYINFIYVVLW